MRAVRVLCVYVCVCHVRAMCVLRSCYVRVMYLLCAWHVRAIACYACVMGVMCACFVRARCVLCVCYLCACMRAVHWDSSRLLVRGCLSHHC